MQLDVDSQESRYSLRTTPNSCVDVSMSQRGLYNSYIGADCIVWDEFEMEKLRSFNPLER